MYDNIENHIDDDLNRMDPQKHLNQILFYVQELGSIKLFHDNEIFVKGVNCEDSLKDLNKACKNDNDFIYYG